MRAKLYRLVTAAMLAITLLLPATRLSAEPPPPLVATFAVVVTDFGTVTPVGDPSGPAITLLTMGEQVFGVMTSARCNGCPLENYVGGTISVSHTSTIDLNQVSFAFHGNGSDSFTVSKAGYPDLVGTDIVAINGKLATPPGPVLDHGKWTIPDVGGGNLNGKLVWNGSTLAGELRLEFGLGNLG